MTSPSVRFFFADGILRVFFLNKNYIMSIYYKYNKKYI